MQEASSITPCIVSIVRNVLGLRMLERIYSNFNSIVWLTLRTDFEQMIDWIRFGGLQISSNEWKKNLCVSICRLNGINWNVKNTRSGDHQSYSVRILRAWAMCWTIQRNCAQTEWEKHRNGKLIEVLRFTSISHVGVPFIVRLTSCAPPLHHRDTPFEWLILRSESIQMVSQFFGFCFFFLSCARLIHNLLCTWCPLREVFNCKSA